MTAPAVAAIVAEVAEAFGVTVPALLERDRVLRARFAAVWVARQATGASFAGLGRALGERDHSTTLHAHRRAEALRASDVPFRQLTDQLLRGILGHDKP